MKDKLRKALIIIIICIIIISIIGMVFRIKGIKKDIEESITEVGIENDEIREGIIKERGRIKREEYSKIVGQEVIVIVVGICGIFLAKKYIKN
jgi:uncharacterized protein YneF (UPF0154 family)